ncbi:MAG: hypothetical protein AABX38_01165 [Candidatus Micrarchaeota archaeon]
MENIIEKLSPSSENSDIVGKWRNASIKYIETAAGESIQNYYAPTRILELKLDGSWTLADSSGTWQIQRIDEKDWQKWKTEPYGPTRKIIFYGWNDEASWDGPIEEKNGAINFFWVIYQVSDDLNGGKKQEQTKFLRSNWE